VFPCFVPEFAFAVRTLRPLGGAGTELAEISLFGASLGGVSLCLRLLRCARGFSFGCVIALRTALKKSRKGPPSATSGAVTAVKIDSERTIVRSDRFMRINRASHLRCVSCARSESKNEHPAFDTRSRNPTAQRSTRGGSIYALPPDIARWLGQWTRSSAYRASNARSAPSTVDPIPRIPSSTLGPRSAIHNPLRSNNCGRCVAVGLLGCAAQYFIISSFACSGMLIWSVSINGITQPSPMADGLNFMMNWIAYCVGRSVKLRQPLARAAHSGGGAAR
jgi:hypothetical protein